MQRRYEIFEVMMTTVIGLMHDCIDEGGAVAGGGVADPRFSYRNSIASMAHTWPMTCAQAATVARQDNSYAAMIYYERVRLGWIDDRFFFDGMPSRLVVMGAPIKLEMPAQQMRDLLIEDVVSDRNTTLVKLEGAVPGSTKRTKLSTTLDGLSDVSDDVPVPARLFLSRLRSMCHGMRAAHPTARFKQCGNTACCHGGRLFYVGEKMTALQSMLPTMFSDVSKAHEYWSMCSSLPSYDGPDDVRFCSKACAREWQSEWYKVMPDKTIDWHPDEGLRERTSSSDARVLTAFDRAIDRNSKLAHYIQKRRKKLKRGSALSKADFNREMDVRIEMANIDVGLLYAASIYTRLPCRRESLTLPGEKATWRASAQEKHRNALLRVAQIYRQHAESRPIHDLLDAPSFFRAVRSSVTTIF